MKEYSNEWIDTIKVLYYIRDIYSILLPIEFIPPSPIRRKVGLFVSDVDSLIRLCAAILRNPDFKFKDYMQFNKTECEGEQNMRDVFKSGIRVEINHICKLYSDNKLKLSIEQLSYSVKLDV